MAEEEGGLRLSALGQCVSIQQFFRNCAAAEADLQFRSRHGASAKLERLDADSRRSP